MMSGPTMRSSPRCPVLTLVCSPGALPRNETQRKLRTESRGSRLARTRKGTATAFFVSGVRFPWLPAQSVVVLMLFLVSGTDGVCWETR
eukprot:3428592-Rhodomonas_salina.2